MAGRPLLFYSAWPLGYHNAEAERKAVAFSERGFDVVYVAGIGMRNPRLSNVAKLGERVRSKLGGGASQGSAAVPSGLRRGALAVVPPRQLAPIRRLNTAWVERQLRNLIDPWPDAVAWVRWPTPELVDALSRLDPAAIVYECVDAYHHTPGVTGRWAQVFDQAERALVRRADAVVVPSESLAERFAAWGAEPKLLPHGVDLHRWSPRNGDAAAGVTVGFVGTLDYRLDIPVLRRVAEAHPEWRLRLIGPAQEGFDPDRLADLANVSVEGAVPYSRLGETLASFDVGIMPYYDDPVYHFMCPVKNLELMAAGRPAVARPTPALRRFADVLYMAETPDEFVRQIERALEADGPERARERRAVAEANTWERRLNEVGQIVDDLLRR